MHPARIYKSLNDATKNSKPSEALRIILRNSEVISVKEEQPCLDKEGVV